MSAIKANKPARASDTTTFAHGYLDESGTGVGPFDPTVAHVDSTGALINPAKDETVQAANAKLDTLHSDLGALLSADSGLASASGQATQSGKLDTLHSDLAALLSADAGLASASGQTAANTKLDTLHSDLQTLAGEEGALGVQADAAWSGTGSGGVVGILKAIWIKLGGTLVVSGATAVGSAPTNPPISVSGVDGSGNKRHLLTDTTGAFVAAQPSSIATNQVSVGATATLICAARVGRKGITVIQEGTVLVRLGASGVTALTGVPLPGTQYAAFTIDGGAAIYGIVASGSQAVSFVESY